MNFRMNKLGQIGSRCQRLIMFTRLHRSLLQTRHRSAPGEMWLLQQRRAFRVRDVTWRDTEKGKGWNVVKAEVVRQLLMLSAAKELLQIPVMFADVNHHACWWVWSLDRQMLSLWNFVSYELPETEFFRFYYRLQSCLFPVVANIGRRYSTSKWLNVYWFEVEALSESSTREQQWIVSYN